MKYIDEYRDAEQARKMVDRIRQLATRRWTLMDVCGGQTHGLLRSGIQQQLDDTIELIHGPGCPVCVTAAETIDFAIEVSLQPDTLLVSFGDMLRVPGSSESLMDAKSRGGNVRIVYSPMDAVQIASENPTQQIVFLAVGFETTTPATALAASHAAERGLENFFLIPAHVRVQPAMESIIKSEDNRVAGFLAAGHVCVVTGYDCYESFVSAHQVPVVVTGFEPLDLLAGIQSCVQCLESKQSIVVNRYGRSVTRAGNVAAQDLIHSVYEVCDSHWRGFGVIQNGGYRLNESHRQLNAFDRFSHCLSSPQPEIGRCRGADVMSGRIKPNECPEFGKSCVPESPLGAPMVSSEGVCAAYYRFAARDVY